MRYAVGLTVLMLFAPVSAQATCTVSFTTVQFGTYNPTSSTNTDTTGTVTVQADSTSCGSYTIALGRAGTSYNPRVFTSGATSNFAFNLFSDAARTVIWGDGSAGTQSVTGTALGANGRRVHTVYGRIQASQSVTPGAYSASIVATSSTTTGSITPASTTFVAATSVPTCNISANAMPFGVYTGAVAPATATLTVNCTNTTPYYINLGNGLNQDGSYYPRMMGPNGALVSYKLYQDPAYTIEWRNTYHLDGQAGTGTGANQTLTVYGVVAAGQLNRPGLYTDTIVATMVY